MLSVAGRIGRAGWRRENRAQIATDRAQFPPPRRPPTGQTRCEPDRGAVSVAIAVGSAVSSSLNGRIGRPSGESRINRLKQFRRIATRYEKRATNYLAMVHIGMLLLWL
jgi:transposase